MEAGGVCPTCQGLYRLDSDERIAQVFDEGTFEEPPLLFERRLELCR